MGPAETLVLPTSWRLASLTAIFGGILRHRRRKLATVWPDFARIGVPLRERYRAAGTRLNQRLLARDGVLNHAPYTLNRILPTYTN